MATCRREEWLSSYTSIKVYADETQVDIANNRSYITTSLAIYAKGGASAASYNCNVTGANGASGSLNVGAGETTLVSGGYWVNHSNDGTGSVTVGSFFTSTWRSMGYGEFSFGLTTIPRASQPSINTRPGNSPNIKAGVACTIHMNRASTSFTHKVTYSIGSASGTIANSGVTDNVSWTPPTSLCAQFPNATSKSGTITVITYNGSTQIGSKTCTFNLFVPDYAPVVSIDAIEELNGDITSFVSTDIIQTLSSKRFTVTAYSHYYASVLSVTCNGVAMESIGNGQYQCSFNNVQTGTFTVTTKDSRGKTNSVTSSLNFFYYSSPTIYGNASRTNELGKDGSLNVSGSYSNIFSNALTVTIKRNDSSAETQTFSGGTSFSKTISYSDLVYTKTFTWTLTVTDKFNQSSSTTVSLGVGAYALWLGKTQMRTSGDLIVGGTLTTGSQIARNNIAPLTNYAYICCGYIANESGGTIGASGNATITKLSEYILQIDYCYTFDSYGNVENNFNWGLNRDLLKLLNDDVNNMNIIPISGGSVDFYDLSWNIITALQGYAGFNQANGQFWTPSRNYNGSTNGAWPSHQMKLSNVSHIKGRCFATY